MTQISIIDIHLTDENLRHFQNSDELPADTRYKQFLVEEHINVKYPTRPRPLRGRHISSCLLSNSSMLPSTSQCQPALYHVPSSIGVHPASLNNVTPLLIAIHCPINSYEGTRLIHCSQTLYSSSYVHWVPASCLALGASLISFSFRERERGCCGFRERALGHCCYSS
jgi:hypothetical protein